MDLRGKIPTTVQVTKDIGYSGRNMVEIKMILHEIQQIKLDNVKINN